MKEVIKFLGNKEDLVWVYPKTTIHKDATVKVDLGYQAIMIRDGEMEMPYFQGMNQAFSEKQVKKTIHNCQIYFFNVSRDVIAREWGTRNPIKYYDKRYRLELTMRGHGTFRVTIDNPRLFLKAFNLEKNSYEMIESRIKDMVIIKLTEVLTKVLISEKHDLLSIHASYDLITKAAEEALNQEFEQYGLSIYELRISGLAPVEEEQIKIIKDLQFKSVVFESEFEMVNKVRKANNEDVIIQNQANLLNKKRQCARCHSTIEPHMKFCSHCGEAISWIEKGESNAI